MEIKKQALINMTSEDVTKQIMGLDLKDYSQLAAFDPENLHILIKGLGLSKAKALINYAKAIELTGQGVNLNPKPDLANPIKPIITLPLDETNTNLVASFRE